MGVVTHTDKRGAYVDVGGKMSAFVATDDITLVLAGVVGLVELAARLHFVEDLAGVILGLFRGLRVGEVSLCKKNQLVPPRGRRGTNCGLRQP